MPFTHLDKCHLLITCHHKFNQNQVGDLRAVLFWVGDGRAGRSKIASFSIEILLETHHFWRARSVGGFRKLTTCPSLIACHSMITCHSLILATCLLLIGCHSLTTCCVRVTTCRSKWFKTRSSIYDWGTRRRHTWEPRAERRTEIMNRYCMI